MRLATIKLSGFKSFVDPTTLHLPTNLSAIVGPNGCGKSNIIDAVRWVMGESAASRLRGDALTDVIFSGSGARKPVGTATVELVFDNSDGLIGGEYAKYAEISVKRTVSRDGQSAYFLNNTRCRRRDIVDVFLGTGLGARSYSIIEQGMISQIIEARPEELRAHLEEAAGISKYKERRKETETRIKATRENLERLNDVRQEVDKNLEHLQRQARAAERWQKLKAEAARVEAELKSLAARALESELQAHQATLRAAETELERLSAAQRELDAQIESVRERQVEATDGFNRVQAESYRIGAEIARVEQQIQHKRDLAARLSRDAQETSVQLARVDEHLAADRTQIDALQAALADCEPRVHVLAAEAEARADALRQSEAALNDWQQRWDAYTRAAGEATRTAEVERTRLDYLDRQSLELARRREQLEAERAQIEADALGAETAALREAHSKALQAIDALSATLEARKAACARAQELQRQLQGEWAQARQQLETGRGRLAALEALQHAALGEDDVAATRWLHARGLSGALRLVECLVVAPGWERAVETVLTGLLDAVLVEDPLAAAEAFAELEGANLSLIKTGQGPAGDAGTLAAHVQGPPVVLAWLARVRTADSAAQAREIVQRLAPGDSVITADGEWYGCDWARVRRAGDGQSGVLARERELHVLEAECAQADARVQHLLSEIERNRSALGEAELARDDAQRELYAAHRRQSELAGQLRSHEGRAEAARQRHERIAAEQQEVQARLAEIDAATREARARLDEAVRRMGDLENQRAALDGERRQLLEAREAARLEAREAREQAHGFALRAESQRTALASLTQAIARLEAQREALRVRSAEIAAQVASGGEPLERLEQERRTYLDQRLLVDRELVEARKSLDAIDLELRAHEQRRHQIERALAEQRETLTAQRLQEQSLRLRLDSIRQAIGEAGFDALAIAAELPADADVAVWQTRLDELEQKIRRLEPVNLAAIGEHAELMQRKAYLDAQYADLTTALETLEGAIRKIDRETRTRFKETFDRVNAGLQELFPRLFGGGHAYLELTGEDLLDTGVSIMARPPGKRVTNISLLSGGEKALTAVALVFAIFRLNPAPFCLLDEVDAPLDEANVGRFCTMVKEMSERVQFICVTHNRVTMEAMSQLCGVTMREPGVSRLVAVDLAEATRLAGAA